MVGIRVVSMGEKNKVGRKGLNSGLDGPEGPRMVEEIPAFFGRPHRQPEKLGRAGGEAEEAEAPALFLLAACGFDLGRRRRAERILDSVGARAQDEKPKRTPLLPKKTKGHARGVEIVGMRTQDENSKAGRCFEAIQAEGARRILKNGENGASHEAFSSTSS